MEAENEDLRAELDAFDPDFFEELEDLKHDRHVLSQHCAHVRRPPYTLTLPAIGSSKLPRRRLSASCVSYRRERLTGTAEPSLPSGQGHQWELT